MINFRSLLKILKQYGILLHTNSVILISQNLEQDIPIKPFDAEFERPFIVNRCQNKHRKTSRIEVSLKTAT